jgi:hypothetical protein
MAQRDGSMESTPMMNHIRPAWRSPAALLLAASLVFLSGCVEEPTPRPVRVPPPPPPVNTEVYAYPLHGQPPEQQDRDRYECSLWASKETGFDPSAPNVPPSARVRVVSAGPPPGTGTAFGAITGAILGAAIAGPRNPGAGAVVGAITGGALGTAADASRAQETHEVIVQDREAFAAIQQQANNYRRAIAACLEGRGYSVR